MFFVTMTSIMSALGLYVCARLIWPLPLYLWFRLVLCLVVLVCANKMSLMFWLLPSGRAMELSSEVLLVICWLHLSVVVAALVALAVDIALLIAHMIGVPPVPAVWRCLVVGLCGLSLAGWGIHNAIKPPDLVRMDVPVRGLPQDLDGFTIGFLADIHLGSLFGRPWAQTIVDLTNAGQPDVIVIAGDIVDGSPEQLADMIVPLEDFRAPLGVYAIVGNHEYYAGLEAWRQAFPEYGIHLLYNEHVAIPVGDAQLVFAGLTDRVTLRGYPGERPDLAKALKGAPYGDKVVKVILEHQPGGARDNAVHGMDIQLSGHTHGGLAQPLQPLVARANGGFVSGQYDVDGMRLIVTNGSGLWAGLPFRMGVPSQVIMLRLTPAP